MRKLLFGLVAIAICLPASVQAKGSLVVVFDIQDQTKKVKRGDLNALADYLASKMAERKSFHVVPRSRLKSELKKRGRRYRKCFNWKCQNEIGLVFKAHKVLATKFYKLGSQCVVVANLYDIATSVAERSTTIKGNCDQDALAYAIEKIPPKLGGRRAKKKAQAAPPPVVVVKKTPPPPKKKVVAKKKTLKKKTLKKKKAKVVKTVKGPAPLPVAKKTVKKKKLKKKRKKKLKLSIKKRAPRRPIPLWPSLVAAGVGVLGLGVGIPLIAIDGTGTDCIGNPLPNDMHCQTLLDTKIAGWVITGVGIAALANSGALLALHLAIRPKEEPSNRVVQALTIMPTTDGGFMLGALGRF